MGINSNDQNTLNNFFYFEKYLNIPYNNPNVNTINPGIP